MSQEKPTAMVKPLTIKSVEPEKKWDDLWLDIWHEGRWICVDAFSAKMCGRPEEFVIKQIGIRNLNPTLPYSGAVYRRASSNQARIMAACRKDGTSLENR